VAEAAHVSIRGQEEFMAGASFTQGVGRLGEAKRRGKRLVASSWKHFDRARAKHGLREPLGSRGMVCQAVEKRPGRGRVAKGEQEEGGRISPRGSPN